MRHKPQPAVLLSVLALSSCAAHNGPAFEGTLASEVLHNDLLCAVGDTKPALQWLDNNTQLARYLESFSAADKAAIPAVDFSASGVIAVAMGAQPSTGYRLNFIAGKGVQYNGSVMRVNIAWEEPEADAIEAQVMTSPCLLLSVERVDFQRIELVDQNDQTRLETKP